MNDIPIPFAMDTVSLLIQIPPEEIAFLSFILESYEGVAIARTVDPHEGLMELMVSPDYQEEMREILKDLSQQFPIKVVRKSDVLQAVQKCPDAS